MQIYNISSYSANFMMFFKLFSYDGGRAYKKGG